MTLLILFPVFLGQVRSIIIEHEKVKLKPDKNEIVDYKITKRAFGFQKKATINVTVTCVSMASFNSSSDHSFITVLCEK